MHRREYRRIADVQEEEEEILFCETNKHNKTQSVISLTNKLNIINN